MCARVYVCVCVFLRACMRAYVCISIRFYVTTVPAIAIFLLPLLDGSNTTKRQLRIKRETCRGLSVYKRANYSCIFF